ncbi:MAG: nucleotidyltransferase family protein [Acetobacter cibinongensis]
MVTGPTPLAVAIILAAGRSSRTAPAHKLIAPDASGRAMIIRTLTSVMASKAAQTVLVVSPDLPAIQQSVLEAFPAHPSLHICTAEQAALGLSVSLRTGVEQAEQLGASAVLVCLGDMPLVSPTVLNALIATQNEASPPPAAAPAWQGRPGNPVIWHSSLFAALKQREGDQGGRSILKALGSAVRLIPAPPEELVDFDTPERLATYARL